MRHIYSDERGSPRGFAAELIADRQAITAEKLIRIMCIVGMKQFWRDKTTAGPPVQCGGGGAARRIPLAKLVF